MKTPNTMTEDEMAEVLEGMTSGIRFASDEDRRKLADLAKDMISLLGDVERVMAGR
jgi:hypothetical protein